MIMEKRRYDYITLDGASSTLTNTNYLTWNIPDYYFRSYKNQDTLYLTLVDCQFIGFYPTNHLNSYMFSAEILADIRAYNSVNSSSNNLLRLFNVVPDENLNYITGSNDNKNDALRLNIGSKFSNISLSIRYYGDLLNFTAINNQVDKSHCKFIFRVDYEADENI